MRRRVPERPKVEGDVPVELAVGRCIEVWSSNPSPRNGDISAHGRWTRAWRVFCHEAGLDVNQEVKIKPRPHMWSAAFMIADGREDEVEARLAAAGTTLHELSTLRVSALERLANISEGSPR
jgi:hypothetical protein